VERRLLTVVIVPNRLHIFKWLTLQPDLVREIRTAQGSHRSCRGSTHAFKERPVLDILIPVSGSFISVFGKLTGISFIKHVD